jgi:hypothetical protein
MRPGLGIALKRAVPTHTAMLAFGEPSGYRNQTAPTAGRTASAAIAIFAGDRVFR